MANKNVRLQRTQKGEDEVRQKTHTLTQSERLVLALIDGLTPIDEVQRKLGGIVKRRFMLIVADLIAKGLLTEEAISIRQIIKLDAPILQQFVRQDPLDPVSITSLRLPLGLMVNSIKKKKTIKQKLKEKLKKKIKEEAEEAIKSTMPQIPYSIDVLRRNVCESGEVDFYLPLEADFVKSMDKENWQFASTSNSFASDSGEETAASLQRRLKRTQRSRQVQIGYWLIFAGIICLILLIMLLRLR